MLKILLLLPTLLISTSVFAKPIEDNSFLLEEAYNQEAGVVQFINGYQYSELSKEWTYTFTNEFPIYDQTHQFSYSLPISKKIAGATETGLGDIALNYRYQLVDQPTISMAPRFSIIAPTGDYKKGLGNGVAGFQFNQAVSLKINDRWSNHWNAGFTYTPDAKNASGDKASLAGFNFGTSAIYNYTDETNLMCEFVVNGNETVTGPSEKESSTSYLILPGFRQAYHPTQNTEIVPGLAAILGFGPSATAHERGAFAYLSIESKLW